jgi:hypothetical protein
MGRPRIRDRNWENSGVGRYVGRGRMGVDTGESLAGGGGFRGKWKLCHKTTHAGLPKYLTEDNAVTLGNWWISRSSDSTEWRPPCRACPRPTLWTAYTIWGNKFRYVNWLLCWRCKCSGILRRVVWWASAAFVFRVNQPNFLQCVALKVNRKVEGLRIRSLFFWNVRQRRLVFSYRRFRTTYQSHPQGSSSPKPLDPWGWDRYVVLKRR